MHRLAGAGAGPHHELEGLIIALAGVDGGVQQHLALATRGFDAAREDQGIKQAQINDVKDQLGRAELVERNNLPNDTVVFGTRVRVKDLDLDEEESFELVGPGQEDYDNNKILTTSPIGQGLLGKKAGEVAEIRVPMGVVRFQILEISFP